MSVPNLISRRHFLYGLGATLGTVAFNALLREGRATGRDPQPQGALTPRPAHHPAKARTCIYLFMEGGVDKRKVKANIHL